MSDNNQQPKSRTAYTTVNSLFDNQHSAMTVGLVESSMYIELRPIFDDMIGKEPEKGKPMYDGDNSIFFRINPQNILLLTQQLAAFIKGDIEECQITVGDRILNISDSESFADANYHVLSISQPLTEGSSDMMTIQFNFAEPLETLLGIKYDGDDATEVTTSQSLDWEWFTKFVLEGAVTNSYNLSLHAGYIASKFIGAAPASGANRSNRSTPSSTRTRSRTGRSASNTETKRPAEKASSADKAVDDILGDLDI